MYPLADGMFAPKNQWYVAAWSSEVTREPMERWILDEPVAFYRTEDDAPVALDGRCPHRSFPLGKSRVVGDNIECGYHGITFRPDGSCARIPSQANIPNVCRVRSYPLAEKWKWIWIWPGDPALADESLIPDHYEIGLTDPQFKCAGDLYNHVPGRYMLLHDNLFDLNHIGFLHRNTFGAGAGADQVPVHSSGPDWIASQFDQPDIECPPAFAEMFNYSGRINRRFGLKLFLPCLHVGGEEIHASSDQNNFLGALRVYHAVTPATCTTSHYFFAAGHSWDHPDPKFAEGIVAGLVPAIAEDVTATQYIEEMISHCGGRPSELLLKADHICVRGRRMFEEMIVRETTGNPEPSAVLSGSSSSNTNLR